MKFSPSGELLAEWGGWGNDLGKCADPKDIAVDGEDNVYVADRGNFRIQKLEIAANGLSIKSP